MNIRRTTKKKANRFETLGEAVEEYKEPDTIEPSSIAEDPAPLDADGTNTNEPNKHQRATDERLNQLESTMGSIAKALTNIHESIEDIRSRQNEQNRQTPTLDPDQPHPNTPMLDQPSAETPLTTTPMYQHTPKQY